MKGLPIGNDDFKYLRDNDGYYVDKTELVKEILDNRNTKAFLFTRPRRFGKSLNMSMIDAFFNIQYKGNGWFEGLKVTTHSDCMSEMNESPVMFISLKGLEAESFERYERLLKNRLKKLYGKFEFLKDSNKLSDRNRSNYLDVAYEDFRTVDPTEALMNLSDMLCEHYGKRCIIIVDEYDNAIQNSYGMPFQRQVLGTIRGLLTNALKSNESLRFGIVTGVMQIAKESVFSGLNNLYVNSIFSSGFNEEFGFTESETRDMLEYYGHPEKYDEVKDWYDGYRFGDAEVYNPWSLVSYIAEGFVPRKYWAGTSGNEVLTTLVDSADDSVWSDLESLAKGHAVRKSLDQSVVYSDIGRKSSAIYSILAMCGYLNARKAEDSYDLSIPNSEMYQVYSEVLLQCAGSSEIASRIRGLFKAMRSCDTASMEDALRDLMRETVSAKIFDSEHVYQAYLIGMTMGFCGNYEIYGDRLESGDGFADIIFKRTSGPGVNIVVELKRSRKESDLKSDAEKAMAQIHEKDYAHGLKGRTILYGTSFYSKSLLIIAEETFGH